MSRRLLGLGIIGLSALVAGSAQAAEYRRITLSDGRVLVAAIEDTTASGLELSMPQGRTSIRFDQVQSLEEVEEATWAAQPSWTIVVLPPADADAELAPSLAEQLSAAVGDIPAVIVTTPDRMTRLSMAQRQALAACTTDAACVQGYLDKTGAKAAISARLEGSADDRSVVVVSNFAEAPLARREVSADWTGNSLTMAGPLGQAVASSLHLVPHAAARVLPRGEEPATPQTQPVVTQTQPVVTQTQPTTDPTLASSGDGPKASTVRAMAWLPVPGLPSLARRDWAGFAASWGVVVPGSVGMIGVAGQASFSKPQLAATGIASFYVLTVATNKAIGLRKLDAQVTAAPLPGGGATVGVSGTLGGRKARRP